MPDTLPSFRKPFIIAVALHIMLLVILIYQLPMRNQQVAMSNNQSIIHATALNSQQVQQAMQAIQQRQHKQRDIEMARLKRLQAEAKVAKQTRLREQRRLAKMKAQQKLALAQQKKRRRQQQLAKQRARAQAKIAAAARRKKQQLANAAKVAHQQQHLQQQLLQQQLQKEKKLLSAANTNAMAGVIDRFKAQIIQAIGQQWVVPSDVNHKLSCQFLIRVAPGGVVLAVKLLRSSGNTALDRSAQVAIYKASPLPVPKNPAIFDQFRELRLTVSPKERV